MLSRKASSIKVLVLWVRAAGYLGLFLVFSVLAAGALRLSFISRFFPALVVGVLLLSLIVTLTLRNQASYNSVLDCLFWDRATVLLLFFAVTVSVALVWRGEAALRAQKRHAAEQGRVIKESLSEAQSGSAQFKTDIATLRMVSSEVESTLGVQTLEHLNNIDMEVNRTKVEDARRRASAIVGEIATSQQRLYELGVPSVVRQYDAVLAKELDNEKSRLVLDAARQYEEAFKLERRLAAQGENIASLAEVADRNSSLQTVDLRLKELTAKKKGLRDEGATLLDVRLPREAQDAMQKLLSALAEQGTLSRSTAELKSEYRDLDSYSGWRPVTERGSRHSSNLAHLLEELAQKRNSLENTLARERDLSDLSSLTNRIEVHVGDLLREFSLRPDIRGEVNRLIQQQAALAKRIRSLQGLRGSLNDLLAAFRGYKTYEHDHGYLISDFKRAQSGDLKALSLVLEAQSSSIDNFDYVCFYLAVEQDEGDLAKIGQFVSEFGDVLKELDALRIILDSDLMPELPAGDSLKQRFAETDKQAKDLQADFVDLGDYLRRKNSVRADSQKRLRAVKGGGGRLIEKGWRDL